MTLQEQSSWFPGGVRHGFRGPFSLEDGDRERERKFSSNPESQDQDEIEKLL